MKPISSLIVKMKPSGIREYFNYASERPEVVSLGVGEPDFTTPLPIIEAGKDSLTRGKTFYTSNQGLPSLRRRISKYLSEKELKKPIEMSLLRMMMNVLLSF